MADEPKRIAKLTIGQWQAIIGAIVTAIISILGTLQVTDDKPAVVVPVVSPAVVVPAPAVTPSATADVPTPPQAPAMPVPSTPAAPTPAPPLEPTADAISLPQWIPTDSDGKRIVSPGLELVAMLPDGDYGVMQIPAEGATFVQRTISIRTSGVPPPVVVTPTLPVDPVAPTLPVDPSLKPTAATYVYEKDDGGVPSGVLAGLNRLNREKKILATIFEDDSTDGDGDVPDQYRAAVDAARATDGPDLIVLAGERILRVVQSPMTAEQVWGAVP